MKNIHVLPTDKPSRLLKFANQLIFDKETEVKDKRNQHIYITNDGEIKEGEYQLYNQLGNFDNDKVLKVERLLQNDGRRKKIILTTDQDLIQDGVQAIDDEFLEWFVKNPSCEFVKIKVSEEPFNRTSDKYDFYETVIPKEEPKQELKVGDSTNFGIITDIKEYSVCFGKNKIGVDIWYKKSDVKLKPKDETLEEDSQDIAIRFLEWYRRKNVFFQFHAYHIPNPDDKNWEQTVFHGDNSYLTSRQLFVIFKKEVYE